MHARAYNKFTNDSVEYKISSTEIASNTATQMPLNHVGLAENSCTFLKTLTCGGKTEGKMFLLHNPCFPYNFFFPAQIQYPITDLTFSSKLHNIHWSAKAFPIETVSCNPPVQHLGRVHRVPKYA